MVRQESLPAELPAELDLRSYVGTRSQQGKSEQPALALSRTRLRLTIRLPGGSEPGTYEVQMLDSEGRPTASSVGEAEIRDYITTLQTTMDLLSVPPGVYRLELRRPGEEWLMFPAQVK